MSFDDIAHRLELNAARGRLGELQWNVEPDASQSQAVLPDIPLEGIMRLLPRRGLEPLLVNHLFDRLSTRPIERALVAWDVAGSSIIGRDDADLVERIATEIAPLKTLGPVANVAVPRDRVAALIELVRSSEDLSRTFDDVGTLPSLEGFIASTANGKAADAELVTKVTAYARTLAHAHLPSLALAFLQIVWERIAPDLVLDFMIELGLDHGMLAAVPELTGDDARTIQRGAYMLLRSCSREYDIVSGAKYLAALQQQPAVQDSAEASLVLAKAELAMLQDESLPRAIRRIVDTVGSASYVDATGGRWRYAIFVCDVADIRSGTRAPVVVDRSITMFGNNARLWGHASYQTDARAELLTLLSRELRFSSHDPEVWRAASILLTDAEPIDVDVDTRLASQLAAAYA